MQSGKKITKEDTWRPDDLKRYIRVEENSDNYVRRQDVTERRHRGGESRERQRRDPQIESRKERDKPREQGSTRDRRAEDKEKSVEYRKEGSSDRRDNRGQHGRDERDKEKRRDRERPEDVVEYSEDYSETRNRRKDKEEKRDRERDKERQRDKEKERVGDNEVVRDKRREEKEKERQREEIEREHRSERRRLEKGGEEERKKTEKYDRVRRDSHRERDRHRGEYEERMNEKETRERYGDRKHSERLGEREYKEEHRKHNEERERRHKERGNYEVERKHGSKSSEHRESKRSVEEVRHHRGDREEAELDKHRERRHREEEKPQRKDRDRRHREEEEPERKDRDRRHREEEEPERKDRDRRHREEEEPERKDRHRRHREEEETERKHRDRRHNVEEEKPEGNRRASSKKTSSSLRNDMDETNTEQTEVALDEDFGDQEYEDDFEDYEEDFEEMDESENEDGDAKETVYSQVEEREELTLQRRKEIEAIQRAMEEENERAGTAQSKQSISKEEEDRAKSYNASEEDQGKDSQRGKFIDFVAAKQREVSKKVATKQKKRSKELLRLIDLDFSMTVSLLDLPPVNEYDMYIRNFGSANTKQAYVQCNEDNADRDIQTEQIEMSEKWTQHPPELSGACGDPNLSQEAKDKIKSELTFDSRRLTAFLSSAAQVMVVLLEEDLAERKSLKKLGTQNDMLSFSEGSLQLNTGLPFLNGRTISMMHFSQVQKYTMMSVHAPTTKPSTEHFDSCTIICIWNIWEPSRPQKILVYGSEIQCCCFSTGKAILVFAGTPVGSVVLWDLREPASNHYRTKIGEDEWAFRQPTFSTDAVMVDSGHLSAVTSVEIVSSTVMGDLRPELPLLGPEEDMSGLSFQLASLDETGVLNFWVVVELPKANEAGSPTDLGLRPGSKVKLLHSSSLTTVDRLSPRDAVKTGPLQTGHLKFLPSDSNHFFIGTNMGLVNHGTSHGLKAPPKFYRFQEPGARPVDVTSIHFSPFRQNLFLVGCGDGCIRLHVISHEQPVAEWKNSTAEQPIVSLQWSQTRATVFCVLDAASNLYIWDLLKNETEPVVTERMTVDRVIAMAVFGDSGQQNIYSGVGLAHHSGKIEIQNFMKDFTLPISGEEEKLDSMMTEAF